MEDGVIGYRSPEIIYGILEKHTGMTPPAKPAALVRHLRHVLREEWDRARNAQ